MIMDLDIDESLVSLPNQGTTQGEVPAVLPPAPTLKVNVDHAVLERGRRSMQQKIETLGLEVPDTPLNPFAMLNIDRAHSTKDMYQRIWGEMMRFFYLIGHFDSAMIVDRANCPTRPVPVSPESLALYMDYRCGTNGDKLLKPDGSTVTDVDGNELLCVGGWNSPTMLGKFHAAVLFLHKTGYPENCGEQYHNSCESCLALNLPTVTRRTGRWDTRTRDTVRTGNEEVADTATIVPAEDDFPTTAQYNMATLGTLGFFKSCTTHANNPPLQRTVREIP